MSVGGDVWTQAVHTELFNAPSIIKCVHVSTPRSDGLLRLRATRILFLSTPSFLCFISLSPPTNDSLSISPLNHHPAFFFPPEDCTEDHSRRAPELWLLVIKSYHYGRFGWIWKWFPKCKARVITWMAMVPSRRWNRKRQTNAFASQPARLKQNKVNNTQQWKDKWWKHLPSLAGREHFTWKQPPEQDLIFAVAVLLGFGRGADVWWAPAVMHSTRNPAVGMSFL